MSIGFANPATDMVRARAIIEIQNVGAFQVLKPSRRTFERSVLIEEIGHRAAQYIDDVPDPADAECEHGRNLIDDCDDCERY